MIVNSGKTAILRYLAGYSSSLGNSLAVGVVNTAPSLSDVDLGFAISRVNVSVKAIDFINGGIIYKATLDQSVTGKIYEVALFADFVENASNSFDIIANFDEEVEAWTGGTFSSVNSRAGQRSLTVSGNTFWNTVMFDMNQHEFVEVAYFLPTANVSNVTVDFESSAGNYFRASFVPVVGYNVFRKRIVEMVVTGTPDLSLINNISITTTGVGSVDMDAIKVINARNVSASDVLIARSILATPVIKTINSTMDIEYYLDTDVTSENFT